MDKFIKYLNNKDIKECNLPIKWLPVIKNNIYNNSNTCYLLVIISFIFYIIIKINKKY